MKETPWSDCDLSRSKTSVKIDVIENLGGTRFIYGTVGEENVIVEARESMALKAGDTTTFSIPRSRALIFSPDGTRVREAS